MFPAKFGPAVLLVTVWLTRYDWVRGAFPYFYSVAHEAQLISKFVNDIATE